MEKELKQKYNRLRGYLARFDEIVIAYSGGVDSSLLLKIARDIPKLRTYALIGKSPSTPQKEFEEALKTARYIGVEPVVMETNELQSPNYCNNPIDRCYHCKKIIFGTFKGYIDKSGLKNLVDGSNYDDINDYRPGTKALEEFEVLSPFKELKITKNEIRALSRELGLPTWRKEAMACLATRIAYGETISEDKLKKIEQAENYLREMGFTHVRARIQRDQVRIETASEELHRFFEETTRQQVLSKLKSIGFKYITIDMEGYRMGGMN